MRALGISCTPNEVLLSMCVDGELVDDEPQKLAPPANLEAGPALWESIDEVARALKALGPDRVGLLLPEANYKATHGKLAPRIVLETLVRLAAAKLGIPTQLLSRPTVRSALGLPRKKGLFHHVDAVFDEPVGQYWTSGRGEAALAAKTLEETH